MRHVSAWFRSHPLTTIFLVLIGFAVGTHLFANWRAEVRWQRYCAAARARGVKLTLAEFAPPEIPDAENFAKIPMLRAIFTGGVQRPMELPVVNGKRPEFGNAVRGERLDWQAWQKFCKDAGWITETSDDTPRDVLRALEHYAPQFKEWSEWRTRPHCRFPLDLNRGFALPLTHLSTFTDAAKIFGLRMRAHLAVKHSAVAYADFEDGLQCHRALEEEPTLISKLVQFSALASLCNAVGEGLRDHAWAEPELRKIESELSTVHVWKNYRLGFSSERGFSNWFYNELAADSPHRRARGAGLALGSSYPPPVFMLIPTRVYRDNQLRQNQYIDELLARASEDGRRFDADGPLPSSPENLTGMIDRYYFFLFQFSAPVVSEVGNRLVHLQTLLDEIRLASALERFRLARGAFPETLTELLPDFIAELPVDTYSRQSLIYRRTDGGTFLLYGVGKNRTDDSGAVNPSRSENQQLDDTWLYAPPPSK